MKKTFVFLLLFSMILASCSGSGQSNLSFIPTNSSDSNIKIPSTLLLDVELPLDYPGQLTSYYVKWITVDADKLLDLFSISKNAQHEKDAMAEAYQVTDGDYIKRLMLHNGILHGGFSYSLTTEESSASHYYIAARLNEITKREEPNTSDQYIGMLSMRPFPTDQDLAFITAKEVSDSTLASLHNLGLDKTALETIQARDRETANYNREIYNTIIRNQAENHPPESGVNIQDPYMPEFTESDEDYYISFIEVLDGIPFEPTLNWIENTNLVQTDTSITMNAWYDQQNGLSFISIIGYCEVLEPKETMNIISPEQALQVYLEQYQKSVHLMDTHITKIELRYVVILGDNGMYARPCWMIHTATQSSDRRNPVTDDPYYNYPVYAVTADTGVILTSNEDMR